MVGFIKIHRKIMEWEWYKKPNMVHLFLHLLVNANSEDKLWQNNLIKRGQLATGLNSLSDKTGLSIRTIRTCLERLKTTNELSVKTTNKFSIITICKYDDYNDNKKLNDKQNDKQTVTPTTTTKKYKNKEDIYIDDILMSKLKSSDFTQGSLEENYFKIVNAFIKVFKENKKELGDSNMTHLNNAKFKPYVEPVRLLMEVDKYKKEDIKVVYDYLKGYDSDFWKPNILSTISLRKKFSKLLIEAKRPKTNYKTQDLDQIEM
jgi:hypothetical protein